MISGQDEGKAKKGASSGPIDFVLVCEEASLRNSEKLGYISTYVRNLEKRGLSVEFDVGLDFTDLVFLKVCGKNVLEKYAEPFNINLTYQSYNYQLIPNVGFKFMGTELTHPDPNSEIYQRARATCSGERPTTITKNERIQIVHILLMRTRFGDATRDHGIDNLIRRGILVTAYPLHDGEWTWNNNPSEPLNDRQLLMKFWGTITKWYKQQPLNTIQYYFGADIAYYFAYFGFYNKLLIYASVAGMMCFVLAVVRSLLENNEVINEACSSDVTLCPVITSKSFEYRKLKDICFDVKLIHLFDNPMTIAFTVFMSFWGTVFICLWQKLHALCMYRWNISFYETYESRLQFEENTPYRKVCEISDEIEAYIPKKILFKNYAVTFATCLTLITIVVFVTISLIFMRLFLIPHLKESRFEYFRMNFNTVASLSTSIISITFVNIFTRVYLDIALWLTRQENPRTQEEFDSSFIYKSFLLAFVNNYSSIVYVAFFKGVFYTHPGDKLPEYKKDQCHQGGCMLGLCIELTVIMLFKNMAGNVGALVTTLFIKWAQNCYKYKRSYVATSSSRQWELEYNLCNIPEYFLVEEYLELIMQYGAVTFFVAAFPLGPLCAVINNVIKLRMDAYKFLRIYRRPIPFQGTRMTAFNNILKIMTFISAITNAFVIGFTSNYVKRTIYMYQVNWDMKGYVAFIHSEFAMKDFYSPKFTGELLKNNSNVTCYYHAMRYPPNHPEKYQLTGTFWYTVAMQFAAVLVFEHLMLVLNMILSHAMPRIPYFIQKQVSYQHRKLKEETIKKVEGTK